MKANEFFKAMGLKAIKQFLENENIRTKEIHDELKRLVESHELVESEGGLTNLKNAFKIEQDCGGVHMTPIGERLFQAIADVESCQ